MKSLGKSNIALVTDLYWVKMASLASQCRTPAQGARLIAWGQFITDLDAQMVGPYMMGGLLGVVKEDGQLFNVNEAVQLLTKGTKAVPDPRLTIYLAYAQLYLLGDLVGAAETLKQGAQLKGAPRYLGPLAARLLVSAGRHVAARAFAVEMSQSSDPETRATFEYRLKEIDREELIATVTDAVATYEARHGRRPSSINELVKEGLLSGPPVDPLGGSIALKPDGTIDVPGGERLQFRRGEE